MYTKIWMGLIALTMAGGVAAAELQGIDAPIGTGIGTENGIEGSGPIKVGTTDRRPGEGSVRGGGDPPAGDAPRLGTGSLKDAIELCERLAGVEREICLQQARENRERALAPSIGGTPAPGGAGAVREEQRESPARR